MRQAPFAVVALLAFVLPTVAHAQGTPAAHPLAPASLALVITYADGRVGQQLVSEKPSSAWTPYFPRTAGISTSSDHRALQLAPVRVGNDVQVTVSMLSGTGYRDEQMVTRVTVSKSRPVTV